MGEYRVNETVEASLQSLELVAGGVADASKETVARCADWIGQPITSDEEYAEVGKHLVAIKDAKKAVKDKKAEFRKPINELLDKVSALFDPLITRLTTYEETLSAELASYVTERDRKAEEERRRALEAARPNVVEQAQLHQQAADAAAAGDYTAAESAMAQAAAASVPVRVAPPLPKVRGLRMGTVKYEAVVTDFMELVVAVASGEVPVDALLPNQAWLDKQADAQRDLLAIPGCTAQKIEPRMVGARR